MEYSNILFPLHTFKDNRMEKLLVPHFKPELQFFKTEQKVVITSYILVNEQIQSEAKENWAIQSITLLADTKVLILFHRIVPQPDQKPISDY